MRFAWLKILHDVPTVKTSAAGQILESVLWHASKLSIGLKSDLRRSGYGWRRSFFYATSRFSFVGSEKWISDGAVHPFRLWPLATTDAIDRVTSASAQEGGRG